MYDVVVIGAGVTGSAIARELMRGDRKVLVVDKASDVCEGTSKANSGIVHAGHDAKPGTLKALLNVKGNQMMPALAKELDFSFKQNGAMVLCFDETAKSTLDMLYEQGQKNGVQGLEILTGEQVREREPAVSKEVVAALYAPTSGIVCPFQLTMALAENAVTNGATFQLQTEVVAIDKLPEGYRIHAIDHRVIKATGEVSPVGYDAKGREVTIETKVIVNAAGVYADVFHNMVSARKLHITPRKGEYCLMDKKVGSFVQQTLFQLPTKLGKGILVTPTVHGNLLLGPTAMDVEDKEAVNTTAQGLETVLQKAALSVEKLPNAKQVITSFVGMRAHEDGGDFILGEVEDAKGFVDAAGIESPGLTCAPAIGEYIAAIVEEILPAPRKEDFVGTRVGIPNMATASTEEKQALIAKNPLYAQVVCRCELVTEGEIMDAIHRPLGATTLDGVKRRTRAGMGRCQAGFCSPKTVEILAREWQVDMAEITKCGGVSKCLVDENKMGSKQ